MTYRPRARQTRTPFVCIERDPIQIDALLRVEERILHIVGDATDQDVLVRARVDTARGLIACMPAHKDAGSTPATCCSPARIPSSSRPP